MGTIDMSSGQRFERRIGRRIDVEPVYVTFFVPESGRFRKKVAAHEVPGHIENVSVTGAAILGPHTVPWGPGDRVVVRSQGADNLVVVRHRHDTPTGTRFGVELTRSATTLKRQIQHLLEPHLTAPKPAAQPGGPVLGLRKEPVTTSRTLPRLSTPPVEAPAEAEAAPPAPLHGPGPVVDLSGPEPVIDITDAVMGLAPDVAGPSPRTEATAEATPAAPERRPVAVPEPAPAAEPVAEPVAEAPATPAVPTPAVTPEAVPEAEAEPAAVAPDVETVAVVPEAEITPEDETEERAVAPRAPAPHLPHSHGRQVLDEVFGLMED